MSIDDEPGDEPQGQRDPNLKPAATALEVLGYLVRSIVDDPDGVRIGIEDEDAERLRLNVNVSPGDMGHVIGRHGRVANAIRTVVRAAAVRDGVEVDVEFLD